MRKLLICMCLFAGASSALLVAPRAPACRVEVQREAGDAVQSPHAGETDVLTATFLQVHGACSIPADKTEFRAEGMEIVEMTPWKESRRGTFVRKIRVKYLRPGEASLTAVRVCPRGGAESSFRITVLP